ncbi:GNAT family N-acetyltransferase [Clostridium sp. 'White wine YQ']|uniref:GNAT family N-acetyltransferase n=1 Tax=Clostridium sp. 'White wine YQ' TaxID=3027474 RepID=UPI002365F3F1|nr:GNAT family protein [Clostridium sp. 'White wine YQ']MDD7794942.1 GNAT family protein [Clostridium sp. 'White wine YQ']
MRKDLVVLETPRLVLTKLQENDSSVLFNYWSDNDVTKYLNIDSLKTNEEAKEILNYFEELSLKNKGFRWGIFSKEYNILIGTCGFIKGTLNQGHIGEISYELGKSYWGNGYMKEALTALIYFGFNDYRLNRIEAYVKPKNTASIKVLENMNFIKEGVLREHHQNKDKFYDVVIYSLLRRETNIK